MIPAEFPSLMLTSSDGARAEFALDGGHVVSWTPAGQTEDRLFVSARSTYGPGNAIRGGIPVIFPQFGPFGALKQHGFARNRRWTVVDSSNESSASATLRLTDDAATRALWPHRFDLRLTVDVHGATLSVSMTVVNTDDAPFTFTAAFHPYFSVGDALTTHVDGLQGLYYRDALRDGARFAESDPSLAITGPVDRIYYDAPDWLTIRDAERVLQIEKRGFPEAVIWNPGIEGTSSRADFTPGEEHRMLCVEAARIQHPITLAPGEAWRGTQIMRAG